MAKQTLKERIITYLIAKGFEQYDVRTSKYVCYRKYHANDDVKDWYYYFIGNNGAVRASKDGNITNAVSITDAVKKRVEQWEMVKRGRL